jgi:N-acetylneuraminic acid mutarotase
MGLVADNDRLYAIGGRIDTPAHNTAFVDIYDPQTDAWSAGASMPAPRSGMAVALLAGVIYVIGGEQAKMARAFDSNDGYDTQTNRWRAYAPLPEGRHGTGAAVIDGKLYVPAGAPVPGGSRQSDSLFIFSP